MKLVWDNERKYTRLRAIKRIRELVKEFASEKNIEPRNLPKIRSYVTIDRLDSLMFDIRKTEPFLEFEDWISKFTGEFKHEGGNMEDEELGSVQAYINENYVIWTHIAGNASNLTFCAINGFTEYSLQIAFMCYRKGNDGKSAFHYTIQPPAPQD